MTVLSNGGNAPELIQLMQTIARVSLKSRLSIVSWIFIRARSMWQSFQALLKVVSSPITDSRFFLVPAKAGGFGISCLLWAFLFFSVLNPWWEYLAIFLIHSQNITTLHLTLYHYCFAHKEGHLADIPLNKLSCQISHIRQSEIISIPRMIFTTTKKSSLDKRFDFEWATSAKYTLVTFSEKHRKKPNWFRAFCEAKWKNLSKFCFFVSVRIWKHQSWYSPRLFFSFWLQDNMVNRWFIKISCGKFDDNRREIDRLHKFSSFGKNFKYIDILVH